MSWFRRRCAHQWIWLSTSISGWSQYRCESCGKRDIG